MTDAPADIPARDYDGLMEGLYARKAALGLTDERLDELVGWASGYTGKLMGPTPSKRLGVLTMFELCQALGLELVLREVPGQAERIQQRCGKRDERRVVRLNVRMARLPWLINKETAPKMAEARRAKIPPAKRRAIARKAIRARWRKHREEQRRLVTVTGQAEARLGSPAVDRPRPTAKR